MKRYPYQFEHISATTHKIGCLKVLLQIPINAGDTLSIRGHLTTRLSQLRRWMTVSPTLDLYAFYVPWRHIWGQAFKDWIAEGVDGTSSLATGVDTTGGQSQDFLGFSTARGRACNLPWIASYARIWNRFFRRPSDVNADGTPRELVDNFIPFGSGGARALLDLKYGMRCGWPHTYLNTGISEDLAPDDADAEIPPESNGAIDVRRASQIRARYKSETARSYFAAAQNRYQDFMRLAFGKGSAAGINTDADERPTMLMMDSSFIGGQDVNGTDVEELGNYTGKALENGMFNVPSRFYPEHGQLLILGLVRFPHMLRDENHPFVTADGSYMPPSYKNMAGDPVVVEAEPPVDLIQYGGNVFREVDFPGAQDQVPFGQQFRALPVLHASEQFDALQGFPWFSYIENGFSDDDWYYVNPNFYDQIFSDLSLGHANITAHWSVRAKRVVPPARSSIFAGAA